MADARQFNIVNLDGHYLCPACGFPEYAAEPTYDVFGGLIGSTICACCLWEPGFDDDPAASGKSCSGVLEALRNYRGLWKGVPVWSGRPSDKPPNWDGETQLDYLFKLAPHVR
jgi:hypothetical protein